MGPVWYAVRADMRAAWFRTAGVVLLLAIGGGAVLSLAGGVSRTLSAPDRYSASIGGEFIALLIAANLLAAVPARRARRSEPGRVLAGE